MSNLLKKPFGTHGKVHEITPQSAGWRYVGFSLYHLRAGERAAELTGDREVILVMVEGKAQISGAGQDWGVLGARMSVFEKTPPHCLYLPNDSDWEAVAETDCVIAMCTAPGKGGHAARRIGPEGITLTERGKGANTRYINNIAMENENYCDSLLVTEVFTRRGIGPLIPVIAMTKMIIRASHILRRLTIIGSTLRRASVFSGFILMMGNWMRQWQSKMGMWSVCRAAITLAVRHMALKCIISMSWPDRCASGDLWRRQRWNGSWNGTLESRIAPAL